MSEITYDDKVDLQVATNIANINKVTASDMNEIKSVVNANAQEMETNKAEVQEDIAVINNNKLDKNEVLNQPSTDTDKPYSADYLNDKLVSIGAEVPENGERVWFKKSKNLLPTNKYISTKTINGVTFTNNGDGTFNISGTATANQTIEIISSNNFHLKQGQAYYLYSSVPFNANTFNLSIAMTDNGSLKRITANNTYTPTAQPTQERLGIYILSGTTINATNVKLMLVKGNTAPSEYEPYIEPSINVDEEEWYVNPRVLFEGTLLSGNTLSLDVRDYSKLEVTVQLAKMQGVLSIDLTEKCNSHTISDITYNYSASAVYGAIDDPKIINKCVVAVSNSLNTILAYNFGYADLSASSWTYTIKNNVAGWGIRKIVGYK